MRTKLKYGIGIFLALIILSLFMYFNFLQPRWRYIIIHHSSTELGNVRIFRNGHEARGGAWYFNDPMLYHMVIGNGNRLKDGYLDLGTRWRRQQLGGGCCTFKALSRAKKTTDLFKAFSEYYNFTGIHICLVGDFEKDQVSPAQMSTLCSVVTSLCRRYDIPAYAIRGHKEVQLAPTNCPGKHFPLERFRKQIATNLRAGIRGRKVSLYTWKIRTVNFCPLLGLLFGEYYYSSFLLLIDLGLFFLFYRIALRLLGISLFARIKKEKKNINVHKEKHEYTEAIDTESSIPYKRENKQSLPNEKNICQTVKPL